MADVKEPPYAYPAPVEDAKGNSIMSNEHVVAKVTDLRDGQMKEVRVGERTMLLARVDGSFHAVGAVCTHYEGPLAQGILCGHHVVCPWHQASFDLTTGDNLEPPALDALPHFDVRIEGEDVILTVPEDAKRRRVIPMAKRDDSADGRTFVIVGAGAAGNAAAETLRQDGFQGRIVMITREKHLPYDRPDLSKEYLANTEHEFSPALRSAKFFERYGIEVLTEREVVCADPKAKVVEFADHSELKYDSLLIATGGVARRLDVPGADLASVFTLRSLEDADRISAAVSGARHAVVIGSSFIGTETASSLTRRGMAVTIVSRDTVPFERTLGDRIGRMFRALHEENGVRYQTGVQVVRFEGQGKVERVVLNNGQTLDADLAIVGIGVRPATAFLKGIRLNSDGSVPVDGYLRAADNVYAAGDIATFPDWRTGEPIRIEHWRLAEQHGRVAAHNMAGHERPFTGVPFFWTSQFNLHLRYVGFMKGWEDILFDGDPAQRRFVAYYVNHRHILAAAGCGEDVKMAAIHELMRMNRMPTPNQLRRGPMDLVRRLEEMRNTAGAVSGR
jgi:NADPH-dependent 2,4-dienoyl-CoA reductase/sulfur reductase-like enzyme/nitrite reductase/ring-hydroxylating ferredoxin subunit